jgi:predicted hydrocarbon binding protein
MKHVHRWIKALMEGLDEQVDGETVGKILENCGRSCTPRKLISELRAVWGSSDGLDDFVSKSGGVFPHIRKDENCVVVEYDKCYCPLVKDYPGEVPGQWCSCSIGWLKELFQSTVSPRVDVELLKSVKRGDDVCEFKILF